MLVVISQFTDWYYYIDAHNYYHRNTYHFISFLIPMAGMLMDFSIILQYRKNINNKETFYALISYIVLPLAATVIQIFCYGMSLINLAICISMILMFVTTMVEQNRLLLYKEQETIALKGSLQSALDDRHKLQYLAETDVMTGILNRGSGEHKITEMINDHVKGLFCLIDCDHFKLINDFYGHTVGDEVIVAVAECLKNTCREKDVVFRLGGDEFAMYLPGLLEDGQADIFIKRVFDGLENIRIPEMGDQKIYISLGATFYKDGAPSFDQLYREADEAMYESKKVEGYHATVYHNMK
ncbi:MAG: GGDEF domain-containing protein [Anaerovoracaceae bacterium]